MCNQNRQIDPKADPMMIHVKFLEAYHNFYSKYENGTNDLIEFARVFAI